MGSTNGRETYRRAKKRQKSLSPDHIIGTVGAYWEGETHNFTKEDFAELHRLAKRAGSKATLEEVHDRATQVAGEVHEVLHNLTGVMPASERAKSASLIHSAIGQIERVLGYYQWDEDALWRTNGAGGSIPMLERLASHAFVQTNKLDREDAQNLRKDETAISRRLRALQIGVPYKGELPPPRHWRGIAIDSAINTLPVRLRVLRLACESFLQAPPAKRPRVKTLRLGDRFIRSASDAWRELTGKRTRYINLEFAMVLARGIGMSVSKDALRGLIYREAKRLAGPVGNKIPIPAVTAAANRQV